MKKRYTPTEKWILRRKLDLVFLYIEAIAMIVLAFMLVFNFYVFVMLVKIYACIALLVGVCELISFKLKERKRR
ncbi:hypothetical protein J2Z60_001919 [Lactobacillus colini]|uniref:Uncharacterized protein n=1 Tax=Lactobacillus colini TaxID=1819254 RepID=A0ABS4MGB7_9LACO|nr:hypothetical protein [Lactobacillus colini]